MKRMKKILSLILLTAVLIAANTTNVFAANVCREIGGTARAAKTFTITTDRTWLTSNKVKLTQTAKGTAEGRTWTGYKKKYYKIWGRYNVTVTDNRGKSKKYSFTGKNLTISGLKKNTKYTVKVVPYSNGSISASFEGLINGGFYGWNKVPCWNVKWTKGITLCS